MKQLLLLFILIPFIGLSQVQIGQDIDGEAANDQSGYSLSLSSDGSIVAVGAFRNAVNGVNSGHVRIFENQSGVWTQIGSDIDGDFANDFFGVSVNLSSNGNIVAISASNSSGNGTSSGLVKVYENQSGVWTQIGQTIFGEVAQDRFGREVSLSADGNILAASSLHHNSRGQVRVFENQSGVWTQIGSEIEGEAILDSSGWSLDLSTNGTIVAIGSRDSNGSGDARGNVRIFENQMGVWTQIGSNINGEADGDASGSTMSLSSDGSIVAIGSVFNNGNGNNSGHVRIFKNISGVWTQIGNDIDGESELDFSGYSVSLSGDGSIVAISATNNDGGGNNSGHVRIFKNISGVWTQIGSDIDGEAANDRFGFRISLSSNGSILAVGATENDGGGNNSGHVRVFDLSSILSINEEILLNFKIFPNPTKAQFTIELENGTELKNVNIYNNLGQLILTSKKATINTSKLASGLYVVEIETNKGKGSKKLIIE